MVQMVAIYCRCYNTDVEGGRRFRGTHAERLEEMTGGGDGGGGGGGGGGGSSSVGGCEFESWDIKKGGDDIKKEQKKSWKNRPNG
ncbi:hypothetical protein M0802_007371 [Mischocyttarus mexicanus]|nr:hypothetical protein M0802_007371 [Mischocyttarus mexicanus]